MRRAPAPAKLNLALVVGPHRSDGKHEVTTVLQRVDLADRVALAPSDGLRVDGFAEDTLVTAALIALAARAGVEPHWRATLTKRVPVAGGLGGGSSDAATALRLANETLREPLPLVELHDLAAGLGADVPFFLRPGPQLGEGDGTTLRPLELPQDFWVVLLLPRGTRKASTSAVYASFDERDGSARYEERRAALLDALGRVRRPRDLAALPPNDLASSPLADELRDLGAFRADVTGAGPTVYGLFSRRRDADDRARPVAAAGGDLAHGACLVRLKTVELPVVDPRVSRTGRWLRERRLRLAVWIAVIEGLLVVFDVIPGWFALVVGAIIVALLRPDRPERRQRHGCAGELDGGDVPGAGRARSDRRVRPHHPGHRRARGDRSPRARAAARRPPLTAPTLASTVGA